MITLKYKAIIDRKDAGSMNDVVKIVICTVV